MMFVCCVAKKSDEKLQELLSKVRDEDGELGLFISYVWYFIVLTGLF